MFKLVKILNSGVNVPEPCRMAFADGTVIKAGSALTLAGGKVANCPSGTVPSYIALQGTECAKDGTILCYRIFENMLFETKAYSVISTFPVGNEVALYIDADGSAVGVNMESEGVGAIIVDTCAATKAGDKVTVKFKNYIV